MQTREILSIVALAALGLCLLCGLAKMAMKNPKAKQACNKACSLLVFVGLTLIGVSQLLGETKNAPQVPAHLIPPAGTLGGQCLPSVMIKGVPQPRCAPGLKCSSDGKCMIPIPDPSGHHHTGTPQKTLFPIPTSGPKPPPAGTLGGQCLPSVMIRGVPQPRCAPGLQCSSDGKCMIPSQKHQKHPGLGQECLTPQQLPGSGLRGNCQQGLVCKSGGSFSTVVPVCQYPPTPQKTLSPIMCCKGPKEADCGLNKTKTDCKKMDGKCKWGAC